MKLTHLTVLCFAVLAFVLPILLFLTAILLYRQLSRERRKAAAMRVPGLDPPLGTRDPALLWPAVLATPPASVTSAKHAHKLNSIITADADDSITISRPNKLKSSTSLGSPLASDSSSTDCKGSPPSKGRWSRGSSTKHIHSITCGVDGAVAAAGIRAAYHDHDDVRAGSRDQGTVGSRDQGTSGADVPPGTVSAAVAAWVAAAAAAAASAAGTTASLDSMGHDSSEPNGELPSSVCAPAVGDVEQGRWQHSSSQRDSNQH